MVGFYVGQEATVRSPSANTAADSNRGRPRDRDRTRRAIVEAARRLSDTKGRANLSLSGIAAEAGFAPGTVYGYFRTKQDLLQSAFSEEAVQPVVSFVELPVVEKPKVQQTTTAESSNRAPPLSSLDPAPEYPSATETLMDASSTAPSASSEEDAISVLTAPRRANRSALTSVIMTDGFAAELGKTSDNAAVSTSAKRRLARTVSDTLDSDTNALTHAEIANKTLRRANDFSAAEDRENKVFGQRRETPDNEDAERSQLDSIIDRLVVNPAKNSSPSMVSRFERRIDLFESELATLTSQQATLIRQLSELTVDAESKTAAVVSKLDAGEQRRLQAVAELRGEILELSLRVKVLEGQHCAAGTSDLSILTGSSAEIGMSAPDITEPGQEEGESPVKHDRSGNLQSYLSMARQSANNAATTSANGSEESSHDIKRYLLLGGVAIVALITAVLAFSYKSSAPNERVTPMRHAVLPSKDRPLRKTAAAIAPQATVSKSPSAIKRPSEAASPANAVKTNPGDKPDTKQIPLTDAPLQIGKANRPDTAKTMASGPAPLDKISALAQAGNAKAQLVIGLKYLTDGGSSENKARAKHWLELASAKGLPVAQYRLGTVYQHGFVGPANAAKAMRWYEAAASHGNVKAMYNLAFGHAEGWDGHKNYAEAARWYSAAARLGYVDAQFNLAILYERGEGVPQSLLEAYKWYSIAARNGDSGAAKRVEMIAPQLSASELSAGQEANASFRAEQENKSANVLPQISDLIATKG